MQKKIIALAVAGLASTAAFAQTNVTIYGVADATYDYVSAPGSRAGLATDFKARSRVTSNSSYIGFKGVEDLGNGLKAVFQFENGLSTENGVAGAWNNRDSYVGLAGGFGTVVMGNLTGPTRALGAKLDINAGATGIGMNNALIGKFGGGSGASHFDQRLNNAVAYVSPNMGGFSGVIGYTAGYTASGLAGAESNGADSTIRGNTGWTLGANFEGGPVYVGYAYTRVEQDAAAGGPAGVTMWDDHRVGAIFKIGSVAQIGALWDQHKQGYAGRSPLQQDVFYVNAKVNVGKGAIIGQFGQANDLRGGLGAVDNTGARHYTLGYEHSLSKRTTLKAVYSMINNQQNASYDFLYGVSAANSTATANAFSAGADPRGLSVGIRHAF